MHVSDRGDVVIFDSEHMNGLDRLPLRALAARCGHRYNPRDGLLFFTRPHDWGVTDRMTANWAGIVVNFLVLAFFAVCLIGIGLGVYAAKVLKRLEGQQKPTE